MFGGVAPVEKGVMGSLIVAPTEEDVECGPLTRLCESESIGVTGRSRFFATSKEGK